MDFVPRFNRKNFREETPSSKLSSVRALNRSYAEEYSSDDFYRSNIGPGSYDLTKKIYAEPPKFSFGNNPRMKLKKLHEGPAVGRYTPSFDVISKNDHKCFIGSSPKFSNYYDKQISQRSPGPVYSYSLDSDTGHKSGFAHVVFLIIIIAKNKTRIINKKNTYAKYRWNYSITRKIYH